ncbi:MAG: protein-L-isoaspartate(D-aspartate) O-methyltransferase [Bacteroidetes bacterium]|nr:MAG: protein-L-isoaspartate(D-aspartate) O-methyltransferase [Bacteroidota bacterium]
MIKDNLIDTYKHKGMRKTLVSLLQTKGITDRKVLAAIEKIPRHYFFESAFTEQAYQDIAFPIGEGQTISQPYTVAVQSQLLNIKSGDKILEIGTGSGYQSMVLLEMGANLYTIEYNKILYERTRKFLPSIGYSPKFFNGDGTKGLEAFAPFDKIIVTAGGPQIPESLLKQLTIGGIIVIPVGGEGKQKMLKITRKSETDFEREDHGDFAFVKLLGKEGW